MKVTVDANILFSAVLKPGSTRRIWFNLDFKLYAPTFILTEFKKHRQYLFEKSRLSEEEFTNVAGKIFSQTHFMEDNELTPFVPAAASLLQDPLDWLYLACALKEDTVIWSNDLGFKKQNRIKVYSTEEMLKEFGLL